MYCNWWVLYTILHWVCGALMECDIFDCETHDMYTSWTSTLMCKREHHLQMHPFNIAICHFQCMWWAVMAVTVDVWHCGNPSIQQNVYLPSTNGIITSSSMSKWENAIHNNLHLTPMVEYLCKLIIWWCFDTQMRHTVYSNSYFIIYWIETVLLTISMRAEAFFGRIELLGKFVCIIETPQHSRFESKGNKHSTQSERLS